MEIDVGYFYFIKDKFFEIINDPELMQNKEKGKKRPCYYCFKSKDNDKIIWFIPVSTKIEKYKKIYDKKIQKEIIGKANKVLNLYNNGMKKIIFPDIDRILNKLSESL